MMSSTLEEQIKLLHEKVDRVLTLLERPKAIRKGGEKINKEKQLPLTADEITRQQERFEGMYRVWDSGEELRIENELNAMDRDELRRFAEANNLAVTSKTSKQKVMQFIAGRFRERRQLMRSHSSRRPTTE